MCFKIGENSQMSLKYGREKWRLENLQLSHYFTDSCLQWWQAAITPCPLCFGHALWDVRTDLEAVSSDIAFVIEWEEIPTFFYVKFYRGSLSKNCKTNMGASPERRFAHTSLVQKLSLNFGHRRTALDTLHLPT